MTLPPPSVIDNLGVECVGGGGAARVSGAELKKRLRYMIFKKVCKT